MLLTQVALACCLVMPYERAPHRVSVITTQTGLDFVRNLSFDHHGRPRQEANSANIEFALSQAGYVFLGEKQGIPQYADPRLPELANLISSIRLWKLLSHIPPLQAMGIGSLGQAQATAVREKLDPGGLWKTDSGNPHFMINAEVFYEDSKNAGRGSLNLGSRITDENGNFTFPTTELQLLRTNHFIQKDPEEIQNSLRLSAVLAYSQSACLVHIVPTGQNRYVRLSDSTLNKWLSDSYTRKIYELNEECIRLQEAFINKYSANILPDQWGIKFGESTKLSGLPDQVRKNVADSLIRTAGLGDDALVQHNYLNDVTVTFYITIQLSAAVKSGDSIYVINIPLAGGTPVTPT
ncbi:hypothetical protein QPK87_09650 [Kamptonema cortianum]|nr:hypothetical protein [Geitlerinema splendidum]MDK3156838.1 hypothetical protein [Kamptonema cortianum]